MKILDHLVVICSKTSVFFYRYFNGCKSVKVSLKILMFSLQIFTVECQYFTKRKKFKRNWAVLLLMSIHVQYLTTPCIFIKLRRFFVSA